MKRYINYGYSADQRTQELKVRGHEIIDELVSLGAGRTTVYQALGRRLGGGQKKAHFSNMRGYDEVERAVRTLEDMLERRRIKLANRTKQKEYKQIVPIDRALLREVGERNRSRLAGAAESPPTFWQRLWASPLASLRWW